MTTPLSDKQKTTLLTLARQALARHVGARTTLGRDEAVIKSLRDDTKGVFVTLMKRRVDGEDILRGCIGIIETEETLPEAVERLAVAAATRDPRFPEVSSTELNELRIEISVLSPPKRIDAHQVEVGIHGLVISRNGHKGLLLPQVATDFAWTAEDFLRHACAKADLSPDAWKDESTTIEAFTAQVFSEVAA